MNSTDYLTSRWQTVRSFNGYLITTTGPTPAPQITALSGTAAERFGATVDLGVGGESRTGVLVQYVNSGTTVPSGITLEVQWSDDGTTFYSAPSSSQGEDRTSAVTSTGNDRSLISRAQVLTRYFRWHLTGAANLPAGSVYLWRGRL